MQTRWIFFLFSSPCGKKTKNTPQQNKQTNKPTSPKLNLLLQTVSMSQGHTSAAVNIPVTNLCFISLCSCPLHCLEFRLLGLSCLVLFHSHIIYPTAAEMQPSGVLTVLIYSVSSLKRIHAPDQHHKIFR